MRFEIRLADGTVDTFFERRDPVSPPEQTNFHSYWYDGHVRGDGALEVAEMVQLHFWASQARHYVLNKPEKRRTVAHYTKESWVNFATVDDS